MGFSFLKQSAFVGLILLLVCGISGCNNNSSFEDIGKYKDYSHEQLLKLAEGNDCEAITQLGRNALESKDSVGAFKWFMKAAEMGYAVAEHNIGVCYENGMGASVSPNEAFKWYMKAAKQGFPSAQTNIGDYYHYGIGVDQDPKKGFEWYMKAAKQEDNIAQLRVANCYFNGDGVSKDPAKAFDWFKKPAENGFDEAQFNVGVCYFNGYIVKPDTLEAIKWWEKASKQGYAPAQYNLGLCYLNGDGVEIKPKEAFEWFMKSAKQDYADAQYYVGFCILNGKGAEKDSTEANKWITKAVDNGSSKAKEYLRQCEIEKQRLEIERRNSSKWKYETKKNPMTDQIGYTATLRSNESHNGAKLELTIAYVNDGKPSMVAMCLNPVDLVYFKPDNSDDIYTVKYRFDNSEARTQECMMRNRYDMVLEHSATAHNAQKYSGNWVKNLINSDKLAIEIATTDGKKIYTFDTMGLEWNHNYKK